MFCKMKCCWEFINAAFCKFCYYYLKINFLADTSALLLTIPERSNADFSSNYTTHWCDIRTAKHWKMPQKRKIQANIHQQGPIFIFANQWLSLKCDNLIFSLALTFTLRDYKEMNYFSAGINPRSLYQFHNACELRGISEFGRDPSCRSLNKNPQCIHTHKWLIPWVHCSCSHWVIEREL